MITGTKSIENVIWESTEDHMISNEQLALIGFANRLGSSILNNEPGIADERDVRQEAQLLMNLFSSKPSEVSYDNETPNSDQYSTSDSSASHRRDSFSFTCPSLSLERSSYSGSYDQVRSSPSTVGSTNSSSDDSTSTPSLESTASPPPAVLFGRTLKVDDRDAFRLNSDAMARNLLQSFQKAMDWRIQAWSHSLSASLVRKENNLKQRKAPESEIRNLLGSTEAKLLLKLREVAKEIDVLQAQTSFRVLPQRVERNDEEGSPPPSKKRRFDEDDIELQPETETEYQYTVAHALTLEGIINLHTPAGYCEISLSVPGTIEGTFLSSELAEEELIAVSVEVDTRFLAAMVEKSCRVMVRSSVEHGLRCDQEGKTVPSAETVAVITTQPKLQKPCRSPELKSPNPMNSFHLPSNAAIVTPRMKSPSPTVCETEDHVKAGLLPIPDDLDDSRGRRRRISPQPLSPAPAQLDYTPTTPIQSDVLGRSPSLVSPPPPKRSSLDYSENNLTLGPRDRGPNLPVLVEVACAAMREA